MAFKVNYFHFHYLQRCKQRVVLNGQTLEWREIISGVPQASVLKPLQFLISINDVPDGISSLCKIFANDTYLFSKVYNINKSINELNANLEEISQWAYHGKYNLTLIPINKQMKLFSLVDLIQQTFSICLLSLIIIVLLNVLVENTSELC